jgi:hypothetical protein
MTLLTLRACLSDRAGSVANVEFNTVLVLFFANFRNPSIFILIFSCLTMVISVEIEPYMGCDAMK